MARPEVSGRDRDNAAAMRHRYLVNFEEDTLRERPLWIRVIIEFIGTFVLVIVAAGSGVINHYAGDTPVSRAAAVIAPGAVVMAMIYAWGPLSGLHINPAVTFAFAWRMVFPRAWVLPYWVAQFAGAIAAAAFLQAVFGHVASGGTYPISKPGGDWRSLVMETVLTFILVSIILNTATGSRSIGHNAAIAVGATVALLGLFASPVSGASMKPGALAWPGHCRRGFRRMVGVHRGAGGWRVRRRLRHHRRARTAGQGRADRSRRRSPAAVISAA